MRLLNTQTLQLKPFPDDRNLPQYAILSHRWRDGREVSFQDMQRLTDPAAREEIKGWRKIRRCCEQAQKQRLDWAWVDTCCIDQTSSAELSEAINSMYRWYANAYVCYAYLRDVEYDEQGHWVDDFERSEWFERGW